MAEMNWFQFDSHRFLFLFIIICSGTEQVGYFLFGCQPHCRGVAVDLFPTVGAAIRQRRIFKAVMAGITIVHIFDHT